MHTCTSVSTRRHATFHVGTLHPTQFIDLTQRLVSLVAGSGVDVGLINVQSLHTTTAIVVNEHEPLLLSDFETLLEQTVACDGRYRHDDPSIRTVNVTDAERRNGHAHCRALLLPPSVCLNVAGGRLQLGRWQRVFLVELDGPQLRQVSAVVLGDPATG